MLFFLNSKKQTAGQRILSLRNALSLSRNKFAKKFDLVEETLTSWELGRSNISEIQLKKLIQELKKENIYCSEEWILQGTGSNPRVIEEDPRKKGIDSILEIMKEEPLSHSPLEREIALLHHYHPKALIMFVPDDAISPFYEKGAYVAGLKVASYKEPSFCYGNPYIVELPNNKKILRIINKGTKEGLFNLSGILPPYCPSHYLQNNVSVKELYQVIWYRKEIKNT